MKGFSVLIESGFTITRGYVFKAYLPTPEKEHYCIVLNKKVVKGNDVVYFYMTSKEKVKKYFRNDPLALIELKKTDLDYLEKTTFIKCDKKNLKELTYLDFIKMFDSHELEVKDNLPESILNKIKSAIKNGKTFSPEEQKRLTE